MDIFKFIFTHFEEVLPIIIFIIIMIASAASSKNKRKGTPPAPSPEHTSPEEDGSDNDLQRTLEEIFKSKMPQHEETRETAYNAEANASDEWLRSVEERKARDLAKEKAKAAAKEKAKREAAEQKRKAVLAAAAIYDNPPPDFSHDYVSPVDSEHSLTAQARSGIIWHEILQAPVGLR